MKSSISLLLALGVVACGTVRPVTGVDSTKVEVHTETRYVHDTAYVELPVIIEKVATLDTTSTLENTYAKSEAVVTATSSPCTPIRLKTMCSYSQPTNFPKSK